MGKFKGAGSEKLREYTIALAERETRLDELTKFVVKTLP